MSPKIEDILVSNHITFTEVRHSSFTIPIRSPFDFAAALGYEVERISKSVFLRSRNKEKYIMAVCSCGRKLDLSKLALLAKVKKLEVADQQELATFVNYPVYSVSSIGLSPEIEVFIDNSLLNFSTILIGSGEIAAEIELSPKDLFILTEATLADISQS